MNAPNLTGSLFPWSLLWSVFQVRVTCGQERRGDRLADLFNSPFTQAAAGLLYRYMKRWDQPGLPRSSASGISLCYWLGKDSRQYDSTGEGFTDEWAHVYAYRPELSALLSRWVARPQLISVELNSCSSLWHARILYRLNQLPFIPSLFLVYVSQLSSNLKWKFMGQTVGRKKDHPLCRELDCQQRWAVKIYILPFHT